MPKELVVDTHDVDSHFLFQYQESERFKDWVKAHLQPAFGTVEGQLFTLLMDRDVDRAVGVQLQQWAKFYGINYSGLSDEQLRSAIYVAAATQFGTGSIYEAKAFFKNYFRAADVKIEENYPGKLKVTILDGTVQPILSKWPPLPPGLAEVTIQYQAATDIIFSFAEDNDPKGAGYALLDEPLTREPYVDGINRYTFPISGITGPAIYWEASFIDNFLNISLVFQEKSNPSGIKTWIENQLKQSPADEAEHKGFISFNDQSGKEWGIFTSASGQIASDLVTNTSDLVRVKCVVNNQNLVYLRVNGMSENWVEAYQSGLPTYDASEATTFYAKNPLGHICLGYVKDADLGKTLKLKPGVGGRYTLLA